jgi:hypothetical protein
MAYKNKEDQKAASRKHYIANKEYYLNRNRRYRKEISTYVNQIKEETPCKDCNKQYPYYVMDFDHLNAKEKVALVSYLCKKRSPVAMKNEILKCEVVCANCHRARTHYRLQNREKALR